MVSLATLTKSSLRASAQGIQVRLLSQAGVEGGKRLYGVVLAAVEAPIHERLDAASEGVEQGGDGQGGSHHCEGGPPPVSKRRSVWSATTPPTYTATSEALSET